MVTGFGFPEVGFHRIPDFGFKKKFSYQLEKFFLTSKVSNGIRINRVGVPNLERFFGIFNYASPETRRRNRQLPVLDAFDAPGAPGRVTPISGFSGSGFLKATF